MKTKFAFFLCATLFLASCQQHSPDQKGMVKITIMYPTSEGSTFDMDYYSTKHMPMLKDLMGDALKLYTIDKGIGGRLPEDPIPYMAIGYLYFDSLAEYQEAFAPNAKIIVGDIPNYTNVRPTIQISEILK